MAASLRTVNRLLPREGSKEAADGLTVREEAESPLPACVTRLSDDAARRFNQFGGR
jgi:hypothetical protein